MPTKPPAPSLRDTGAGDRIAKLLARAGVASRREVERMIADGRVARDGVPIDTPATLLTSLTGITVDGEPVAAPAATRLFIYNKPVGLLVTEWDPAGRSTIYDRLPAELPRVVPVGRLDLGTEGLLLLTTDGGLKRQLELPATGVERTYRARAYGPISQEQLEELIHGIEIEGIRYGPIDANLERRTGANTWIELTLTEGKNREVRRVLEHLGLEISRLIRTRYGPFVLGDMPTGEVGEVRQHDLENFRKTLKVGGGKTASDMAAVMAEPLAKAVVGPAKPERAPVRATAPARRDDGERSSPQAADRGRPAPTERRQPERSSLPAPARKPVRSDGPSPIAGGRRNDRASRFADEGDERPRVAGNRTRTARDARPSRALGGDKERARPTSPRSGAASAGSVRGERPERSPARSLATRPNAQASADRPAQRTTATSAAKPPRPAASRPGAPRSPDGDRPTRGPAGGRGKPASSLRRPTGPRGKR